MPSVDKALRALLVLADAGPAGMPLSEVASRLGLNKSSLHVTLNALRFRDFVAQSPSTGFYCLGSAVGQLSQTYLNSLDIRSVLRPAVILLAERINEVCHIAVLDGTEILYIEKIESMRPIQPGTRVGMRLPALTTAMGRAMIAFEYPTYDIFESRFDKALFPRTPNAPTTLAEEWERIQQVKKKGFGVDRRRKRRGADRRRRADPEQRPAGRGSQRRVADVGGHRPGRTCGPDSCSAREGAAPAAPHARARRLRLHEREECHGNVVDRGRDAAGAEDGPTRRATGSG